LTGGALGVLTLGQLTEAHAAQASELDPAPFALGVASGGPDHESVDSLRHDQRSRPCIDIWAHTNVT
jgi:hypothetical protein